MKAELTLPEEFVDLIADRVIEKLKPFLSGNGNSGDRLFTVKQLSEYLGLSRQWIYNNKRKLEPEYLNGKPLFRLSKINAMLKTIKEPITAKPITTPLQAKAFKQQKAVTSL